MRTYFVAPNFDIPPPPDGPLKLGHIIPGPDEPNIEPVNRLSHQTDFKAYGPITKHGFSNTRNKLRSGEIGFWAHVASFIGIHAEADFDVSSDYEIKVQELETFYFHPSDDYIRRSVASPEVVRYISQNDNTVPLYMIVGLKIAKGASVGYGRGKTLSASAAIATLGPGLDIGPKAGASKEDAEREAFEDSSDFILAFRLERIRFKKIGGSLRIRDHTLRTKGAKMTDCDNKWESVSYEYDELDDGCGEEPGSSMSSASRVNGNDDDGAAVSAFYLH